MWILYNDDDFDKRYTYSEKNIKFLIFKSINLFNIEDYKTKKKYNNVFYNFDIILSKNNILSKNKYYITYCLYLNKENLLKNLFLKEMKVILSKKIKKIY